MIRSRLNCYRWEAIHAVDFTLDAVRRRCRLLAETLLAHKWSCLVAHDTRFMAGQFGRYAYRTLESRGVQVSFCPTPAPFPAVELALDQRRADTALIVSAGNRPFWCNGLIALTPPTNAANVSPLEGPPAPPEGGDPLLPFPPLPLDDSDRTSIDLRSSYLESLRSSVDMELIRRVPLTVFVDPMNGATSGYIPAAISEGGQTKAIEINRETDPLFGRQPPQPTEVSLSRLRKLVKESDSHLGVALSADGRAISVADNVGDIVPPLDLALLLAHYLSRQQRQRGAVVVPAPADPSEAAGLLRAWEAATGLKAEVSADPGARIAALVSQDRMSLLVGATAAGEITLSRAGPSPDATLVALQLLEIVARSGGKLRALLDEIRGKE